MKKPELWSWLKHHFGSYVALCGQSMTDDEWRELADSAPTPEVYKDYHDKALLQYKLRGADKVVVYWYCDNEYVVACTPDDKHEPCHWAVKAKG